MPKNEGQRVGRLRVWWVVLEWAAAYRPVPVAVLGEPAITLDRLPAKNHAAVALDCPHVM